MSVSPLARSAVVLLTVLILGTLAGAGKGLAAPSPPVIDGVTGTKGPTGLTIEAVVHDPDPGEPFTVSMFARAGGVGRDAKKVDAKGSATLTVNLGHVESGTVVHVTVTVVDRKGARTTKRLEFKAP